MRAGTIFRAQPAGGHARDEPGLKRLEAGDILVICAAATGQTASGGAAGNSPFGPRANVIWLIYSLHPCSAHVRYCLPVCLCATILAKLHFVAFPISANVGMALGQKRRWAGSALVLGVQLTRSRTAACNVRSMLMGTRTSIGG